ncbi:MAG: TrkH family potassium uptake protein [Subdoligranulum sp.]|nr:TrkH family potassium uptake protein [Subdoligranulum sp.]
MNKKMIARMLGVLFALEALFMLPAIAVCVIYGETGAPVTGFLWTVALLALLAGALMLIGRKATRDFYAREGFIIVALGWTLLSAAGALPFWISREIPHYVDAFFETVSGFTTTGSSILSNVEGLSHGLLYWRSFTHWLGGMGMLVFLLAVVPTGKGSGYSIHLLRAESPGPTVGKIVPRMRQTASLLYKIYIVLTILCVGFLLAGGMPLFDSLCTAFGTAGTGGFGIKNDSMAGYSPYLQNVCTVFMALFGVNFSIYFLLLLREWRAALFDEELLLYLGIMLGAMFIIAVDVRPLFAGFGEAFHHASFTVSSVMTTTGFATADFNVWPQLSRSILCILMVIGASAGSTGGGVKVARILLLGKSLSAEVRRMLRPRSVNVVRVNQRVVSDEVLHSVNVYMAAYCALAVVSFLLISLDDFSMETNMTAVMACLNNIGPGLDLVGPTGNYAMFSPFSKIVLSLDMLLGRLEIFPILVLFSRHTWNRTR